MPTPDKSGRVAAIILLAAAVVPSARAVEIDKFLPPSTEAVVVINVRELLNSPVIKNYGPDRLKTELETNGDANRLFRAFGIDPLRDVREVAIAVSAAASDGDRQFLIVLHGEFKAQKELAALGAGGKTKTSDLQIVEPGGHKLFEVKRHAPEDKWLFAEFADNNTLLVSSFPESIAGAFKGGARASPEMAVALGAVGGKESVYAAAVVSDQMKQRLTQSTKLRGIGPKLLFVTGFLDLTDDVKLRLSVHTSDAEAADKVKTTLVRSVPLIGMMAADKSGKLESAVTELVKKIEVDKDDRDAVHVSLTVTAKMMNEIEEGVRNAARGDKLKKP
jgi:hypothetical protein